MKERGFKKYGITQNRFRELKYFCMQYDDKKRELNNLTFIASPRIDGQPRSNNTSDPTAKKAMRISDLKRDIEIIEKCAYMADKEVYQYIITNVTKGLSYDFLGVPMGKNQFYAKRRKFFWLLNENK